MGDLGCSVIFLHLLCPCASNLGCALRLLLPVAILVMLVLRNFVCTSSSQHCVAVGMRKPQTDIFVVCIRKRKPCFTQEALILLQLILL